MDRETTERCRCCNAISSYYETANVLGRYKVRYYCCPTCGFIQTEPPFWLAESYKTPMTSYDLGGVSRPTLNSVLTKAVINWFFDAGGRFLDFGGGYGVFTRWMRDEGYDFFHYDQHCTNLFAPGHDADISGSVRYELITAFEVFEHLAEPAKTVAQLLSISDSILFSTELLPIPAPPIADWWYYGPEHGQHIAFFTRRGASEACCAFRRKLLHEWRFYPFNFPTAHLAKDVSTRVTLQSTRVSQPCLPPQVFIGRRFRFCYATSEGSG